LKLNSFGVGAIPIENEIKSGLTYASGEFPDPLPPTVRYILLLPL
jgi:hypothetical protein